MDNKRKTHKNKKGIGKNKKRTHQLPSPQPQGQEVCETLTADIDINVLNGYKDDTAAANCIESERPINKASGELNSDLAQKCCPPPSDIDQNNALAQELSVSARSSMQYEPMRYERVYRDDGGYSIVCKTKNPGSWNPYLFTEMAYAIENNLEWEIVKLLNRGADIEAFHLHRASSGGRVGIVRQLLRAGADVNALDSWGETAMGNTMKSLRFGRYEVGDVFQDRLKDVVHELLKAGSDLEEEGGGRTILFRAAEMGNLPLVRILLAAGANPFLTDRSGLGRTPRYIALYHNHFNVADVLGAAERGRRHVGTQGLRRACADVITRLTPQTLLPQLPLPSAIIRILKSVDTENSAILKAVASSKAHMAEFAPDAYDLFIRLHGEVITTTLLQPNISFFK